MFSRIVPDMPANRDKIVFSVRGDRFPEQLWRDFRAACADRNEKWIDVLRRLCAQYVAEQPPKPEQQP